MDSLPRAKKSLGQNFLVDGNYQRKILEAVRATSPTSILEIGPGQGALTQGLLTLDKPLWLVEKDRDLVARFREQFPTEEKVTVIEGDFLEVDLENRLEKAARPIVAVGNLPYNVASQIFIRLIEKRSSFSHLLLMFQKEMALRFTAKPGTKDYGLLSLWAQIYSQPEILFHLPPSVFRPQPKVTSSFVHFRILEKPLIEGEEADKFFNFLRLLFQSRRKTILSTLKMKNYPFREELLTPNLRAETLSPLELIELFRKLK